MAPSGWLCMEGGAAEALREFGDVFQEMKMLRKLRTKWYLLVVGSSICGFAIGQCVADIIEDAVIFSIVD